MPGNDPAGAKPNWGGHKGLCATSPYAGLNSKAKILAYLHLKFGDAGVFWLLSDWLNGAGETTKRERSSLETVAKELESLKISHLAALLRSIMDGIPPDATVQQQVDELTAKVDACSCGTGWADTMSAAT
jgi:hypothetical protein